MLDLVVSFEQILNKHDIIAYLDLFSSDSRETKCDYVPTMCFGC